MCHRIPDSGLSLNLIYIYLENYPGQLEDSEGQVLRWREPHCKVDDLKSPLAANNQAVLVLSALFMVCLSNGLAGK